MSKRKPYQFEKPAEDAKVFWTSLEAKADPEAFQERASAEFPLGVAGSDSVGVDRRTFLGVAGGVTALLGLEGCVRRPDEKILPFNKQPEYMVPGVALHYATSVRSAGDVLGLLVTTHEGRPTKVEGNPQHPASLGATDGYAQATILDLYDPDRSPAPAKVQSGAFTEATFADFDAAYAALAKQAEADGGASVRVLAEPSQSPTFVRAKKALLEKLPNAKLYSYEPVGPANRQAGAKIAFGQAVDVAFNLRRARTIVALDADILGTEPGSVRANREFADGRRMSSANDTMNRLYVVEPGYTVTGASADHRLRLAASEVFGFVKALASELATKHGLDMGAVAGALGNAKVSVPDAWISKLAAEIAAPQSRGRSVLVAGTRQPAAVHALVFAINVALGNVGSTVQLFPAVDADVADATSGVAALAQDLASGNVGTLLILGGNPVHDAPADLKLGELVAKAKVSIHLSEHRNETSAVVSWHVPRAHALESWGDLRGSDGTFSLQQPMIAPMRGGRTDAELVAHFAGIRFWRAHPLVRQTFRELAGASFEQQWKSALHLGVARDLTAQPLTEPSLDASAIAAAVGALKAPAAPTAQSLEVSFAADSALYDGRHANNPWMLELPEPLSCISWDNAAYFSPETAKALGVQNHEMVRLKGATGAIDIVAWVLPGQADNSVTVHLGWGRKDPGRHGAGYGFDAYPLRTTQGFGFASGVSVEKLGTRYSLSQTQEMHSMQGRPIALDATLDEYRAKNDFAQFESPTLNTLPLWTEVKYEGHKWALTIDLNACTGCNACLVACQAENNVPTVGKEQVARGRDMYWLRLDRYFVGESEADPQVAFQPVGCVHCEEAPCENVCPVNATAHSPEGLNDMAYNRCIGTRYCTNNCPYKVRRFNFLDFTGQVPETRRMQFNPNVSVRMRGVMEKCSYCVQRIQEAKIASKRDGRPLRDGQIRTACQQACPAGAIVFGDLNEATSRAAKLVKLDRAYKLLPEIGTQPRTTYLAKIRNPNPEMQG
jgi:molybdopterin-containing oxidoreductase family iron-sulfur binding subunit